MISLIAKFWKNQKPLTKIFLLIIAVLLIFLSIQSVRLAFSEYKRLKSIEMLYNEYQRQIEESEKKELDLVKEIKDNSIKAKKSSKLINEKLKKDEKIIDTSNISNDELLEFISKHEN